MATILYFCGVVLILLMVFYFFMLIDLFGFKKPGTSKDNRYISEDKFNEFVDIFFNHGKVTIGNFTAKSTSTEWEIWIANERYGMKLKKGNYVKLNLSEKHKKILEKRLFGEIDFFI